MSALSFFNMHFYLFPVFIPSFFIFSPSVYLGGRRSLYKSCHYFLFYPNYFTHCLYLYSLWCEEIFWELLYLFHYFCSRFFWSPMLHSFAPDGNKYLFFSCFIFVLPCDFFFESSWSFTFDVYIINLYSYNLFSPCLVIISPSFFCMYIHNVHA